MTKTQPATAAIALFLGTLATLGMSACTRSEAQLGPERSVPAAQRPTEFGKDARQRFGMEERRPAGLQAATPSGWQEMPGSEMRQLNWRVAGRADAECYLTTANLRGGVLANVNRWVANQFGQPPLTEAQFAALPRHPLLGHDAVLVTAEGSFQGMGAKEPRPGFKLLGLVGGGDDDMVTLKFTGPREVVDAERERFLALAASIRRGGAGEPATGPTPASPPGPPPAGHGDMQADAPGAPFTATIPEGWSTTGDGSRLLHHRFGEQGECYVGQLGGELAQMLGIWCAEVSAPAPDGKAIAALPKVELLGGEAVLLDLSGEYRGTRGKTLSQARLLVAVRQDGQGVVFAKCLGPAAEVESQRAAFLAFCKSLRRSGS